MGRNSKLVIGILVAVILVGIIFFSASDSESKKVIDESGNSDTSGESSATATGEVPAWMDLELEDVRTGEIYRIGDFKGKPVLIEGFAVWCPTCTKQQKEVKKFHEEVGDSVISISLDTDPNEDKLRVLEHVKQNEFGWFYSVSPVELTQSLIAEFGVGVVNAPSVPMILICEDGNFKKLGGFGVRDVDELKEEIARGC